MKAILSAIALVITAMLARAADEPIVFAPGLKTSYAVTEGRRLSLQGELAQGTNAKFQWFKLGYVSASERSTNAITGATNLTYTVEFADSTDSGEYLLKATNAVSEAAIVFGGYIYSAPNIFGGFTGWQGLKGETYNFDLRYFNGGQPKQWFKNNQPTAPPPLSGILDEQTEGTYYFIATNEIGDEFVSPRATLRIAPVRETSRNFRRVIDGSFMAGRPGQIFPNHERMHEDGSVTFLSGKSVHRWKRGVIEKILDLDGSPEVFAGADWSIGKMILSENQSCADIEALGNTTPVQKFAFLRKDANGFKTLGVEGMAINTDPPLAAVRIRALQHAAGKSAFWAAGPEVQWPNNPCFALKVYDGAQTTEWFNSNDAWPESISTYAPSPSDDPFNNRSLGFDGTTAAFVARDNISHRSALVAVTAAGQPIALAKVGDLIPGTTNRFRNFDNRCVKVRDGKILFQAAIIENFLNRVLVEYDPNLPEKFRLIAIEGQSVGELSIAAMYALFDYRGDGSVVFNALAGYFHAENQLPPWSSQEQPLETIFSWKNGTLSAEVTSRERFAGAQLLFTFLANAAGTNYLFNANGTLWTTAPGADRPANAQLTTQSASEGLQASWTGDGILQSSADFVRWKTHLYSPGVITNQLSTNAQFFRVFYP